ncbi:MAG: DUF357 domain-containing protein [Fervidicoccaceae archaeon]
MSELGGGAQFGLEERVSTYAASVERALKLLETQLAQLSSEEKAVVELARLYLEDAKYYWGLGDLATALAAVSYAEGLIDALARLGRISIEWRRAAVPRVVVAGTFDLLHPGHVWLLRKASEIGEVHVIVARDSSVRKFKGRDPIVPEDSRLYIIENLKPVRRAHLGDPEDYLKRVVELKPDVVLLGPDQWPREPELEAELRARGLRDVRIVRVSERLETTWPNSSTQLISRILEQFCREESKG